MSGDVIKEFLVALGYEVDESSEQKVTKSVATVEKQSKQFSEGFEKREKSRAKVAKQANEAVARSIQGLTATVFGVMSLQRVSDEFARVTKQMEGLYYTAERTGTAVGSIRGLSDAFSRMGLDAQDAVGAMENLARTMRMQPGARGLLASYGIDPKGDQAENLLQLAESLKKRFGGSQYGYATAARIAGEQFGVSENVFFQIWNDPEKVRAELEKSKNIRGPNQDENAKAFQQLSNNWKDFLQRVEGPLEEFEATLAGPLSKTLKAINENGLAPFVAGLGTLLSLLVGGTALMSIGRLFGFGAAGAAAGAAGAAGAAAGGGLLGGLARGLGRLLWPVALGAGAVGHGFQTGEEAKSNPENQKTTEGVGRKFGRDWSPEGIAKRKAELKKDADAPADGRPWYKRAFDWVTGRSAASTDSSSRTPHEKALLDVISDGEADSYNRIVGGGTFEDYSKHPNTVGMWTAYGPSTAAGKYQFTNSTWAPIAKELGLPDFSPESQDKAALHKAKRDYKRRTGRDLMADLQNGETGYLREGLGGVGADTSWQAFQKKTDARNKRLFDQRLAKYQDEQETPAAKGFLARVGEALKNLPKISAEAKTPGRPASPENASQAGAPDRPQPITSDAPKPPTKDGASDWIKNHLSTVAAHADAFDKQTQSTYLAPSPSSMTNDNSRSVSIGDTTITVHGSMDADMAAALIGRQQRRLNQDLLSSVEGAVR